MKVHIPFILVIQIVLTAGTGGGGGGVGGTGLKLVGVGGGGGGGRGVPLGIISKVRPVKFVPMAKYGGRGGGRGYGGKGLSGRMIRVGGGRSGKHALNFNGRRIPLPSPKVIFGGPVIKGKHIVRNVGYAKGYGGGHGGGYGGGYGGGHGGGLAVISGGHGGGYGGGYSGGHGGGLAVIGGGHGGGYGGGHGGRLAVIGGGHGGGYGGGHGDGLAVIASHAIKGGGHGGHGKGLALVIDGPGPSLKEIGLGHLEGHGGLGLGNAFEVQVNEKAPINYEFYGDSGHGSPLPVSGEIYVQDVKDGDVIGYDEYDSSDGYGGGHGDY